MDCLLCNTEALRAAAKKTEEIKNKSKALKERMDKNIAMLINSDWVGKEGANFYNEYEKFTQEFKKLFRAYDGMEDNLFEFANEVEDFDRKYSTRFNN